MSFAAAMSDRSTSMKVSFAQQVQEEVAEVVDEEVARLESVCASRADLGYTSAEMNTKYISVKNFFRPNVFGTAESARDMITFAFRQKFKAMGFTCYEVTPFRKHFSSHEFYWPLHVSWDGAEATGSPAAEAPCAEDSTASAGTCAQCPVCWETAPVVVLVPCGHTVCRQCGPRFSLAQCPMCRQQVMGATQGLFLA
eukprot:TRINITY_DN16729_c0_g2_i1.p1 TRINITY_DN16729_c0_g2~~TRINITY_DN16729_c0_g2_i1.p1  ORF type:complete len:197 (+),score=25.29 TRINITY_DN16729_c0_g2_i1:37-627(+)